MDWKVVMGAARAELRAGVGGFRLFVACLAIGVAAIAGAGSTADAFRAGLAAQSRTILGGDLAVEFTQDQPSAAIRSWLEARGRTSALLEANAMASGPKTRHLVRVRAVDGSYPLAGGVQLEGGGDLQGALAPRAGVASAVAEPALFTALGAKVGDRIILAAGQIVLTGIIAREPDAIGQGFAIAPRLLMRLNDIEPFGLGRFGSLYQTQVRVALRAGAPPPLVRAALERAFPITKGRVRTRENAAPGLADTINRVEAFLSFVGLATLLAGGLGVQGAVQAYVHSRRAQIATLKALGASGAEASAFIGVNVAALAVLGLALGLAAGACAPWLVTAMAGDCLPIRALVAVYPGALGAAAALGALAAFAFAIGPIGSARTTAPAALYRGVGEENEAPPWPERIAAWAALGALACAAAGFSKAPVFAGALALGAFAAFAALRAFGLGVRWLARRAQAGAGVFALALAALGGRGSLAPAAAPAIGLGVALLAFLIQIQTNLVTEITQTAPKHFATGVFMEVPPGQGEAFDALAAHTLGRVETPDWYQRAPVVTARLVSINQGDINAAKIGQEGRWVSEHDVSASYTARQPDSFTLTAGRWWPASHQGAPLVSLDADIARALGARIGDVLGFEVLGQHIDAQVANLRRVDYRQMGANFAIVFAPNRFAGLSTRSVVLVRLAPGAQGKLETAVASAYPNVVILRVRDALQAAADLFASLTAAINAIAILAIATGALAVTGAIAAGLRRRVYDGAILKTLGFTRAQIVAAVALEMGLVGFIAAALGAFLGLLGAYPIVVDVIEAQWSPALAHVALICVGAALGLGSAGALVGFVALATPPARVLRAE